MFEEIEQDVLGLAPIGHSLAQSSTRGSFLLPLLLLELSEQLSKPLLQVLLGVGHLFGLNETSPFHHLIVFPSALLNYIFVGVSLNFSAETIAFKVLETSFVSSAI